MERAAQPSAFEPSEGQVRAAMRTGAVDEPVAALLVTKEDEVLTEELDRFDRTLRRQLFNQRGRLPVKPHQLSGRPLRPGARDQLVALCTHHDEMPRQDCAIAVPRPLS